MRGGCSAARAGSLHFFQHAGKKGGGAGDREHPLEPAAIHIPRFGKLDERNTMVSMRDNHSELDDANSTQGAAPTISTSPGVLVATIGIPGAMYCNAFTGDFAAEKAPG